MKLQHEHDHVVGELHQLGKLHQRHFEEPTAAKFHSSLGSRQHHLQGAFNVPIFAGKLIRQRQIVRPGLVVDLVTNVAALSKDRLSLTK